MGGNSKVENIIKKINEINKSETAITVVGETSIEHRDVSYEIASNSKAFTAMAILFMEHNGYINIEDNIGKYLSSYLNLNMDNEKESITILQLLNHTSGLSDKTYKYMHYCKRKDSLKSIAEKILSEPILEKPGQVFKYSTAGYCILGYLIECISGESFDEFMEKKIFKPLGLNNTQASLLKVRKIIKGTQRTIIGKKMALREFYEFAPAGFIYSTPEDMSRWIKIQLGCCDIPKAFQYIIGKSQDVSYYARTEKKDVYYGFGWFKNIAEDFYYHDGMNPFFSSYVIFDKKNTIGVIVLNNILSSKTPFIARKIFNILRNKDEDDTICKLDKEDKKDITFKIFVIVESIISFMLFITLGYSIIIDIIVAFFLKKGIIRLFLDYKYWRNIKLWVLESIRCFIFTTVLLISLILHISINYLITIR